MSQTPNYRPPATGLRRVASVAPLALLAAVSLASANPVSSETARAARFDGTWNKSVPALRYARDPPLRPEAQARFDSLRPQDDPGARCVESGTPRMMISPYPMQVIALSNHVLVVHEFNHVVRRIWTDTKAHAPDPDPSFYGDSVVTWDGDVMVVSTKGYNGRNYLDPAGDPMSDAMHIVERWRLTGPDKLEIDFTFDDPKNYTRPWSSTLTYDRVDWKLGEFSCTENNRNNPDDPNNPISLTSTAAPAAYTTPGSPPPAR